MQRKPVIGVMGGAAASTSVQAIARQLGGLIAQRGWVLLNGGRNTGVMAASAQGAREAGGLVIGILPDRTAENAAPHLDVAVVTGQGDDRNLINVLTSDVVIACPGDLGTLTEVLLAAKNGKPVILLQFELPRDLIRHRRTGKVHTANSPSEAIILADALLKR